MISKNQVKWVRQLELKKNRRREGLFVAEGPKVVGDLLQAGFTAKALFSTREREDAQTVTDDELRRLSFLQHPQEILGVFHIPEQPVLSTLGNASSTLGNTSSQLGNEPYADGLCLALDGVQDPGNLGTIIRIADWFGIKAIYCSPDTADAYNPKVVQATMGSLAHVPVVYCQLTELLAHVRCPIYGTLLDGDNIYRQELAPQGIIVMGNEGNGISQAVRSLITHRLLIPNFHTAHETAESLNVAIATAITCSEFRRRGI
jgi:TrmH family RNA methyltransferase